MNKIFVVGLVLASVVLSARAEDALTPDEQYALADKALKISGAVAWKLEYGAPVGSAATYQPEVVESLRDGAVQKDSVKWSVGKTTEAWWLGGDYFAESPIAEGLVYGSNRWPADRPGIVGWITKEYLKGIETVRGKKSVVFQGHLALKESSPGFFAPDTGPEAGPGLNLIATISLEEDRSILVEIDGRPVTVTWVPVSGALPAVPEKFSRMKEKFDKRRQRLAN